MTALAGRQVFVTGASGLIGDVLCAALVDEGAEVVALTRSPARRAGGPRWLEGDVTESGAWQHELAASDAVIHLAGESIASARWTPSLKQRLRASRIEGTRRVVEAIERASARPRVLVSASACGIYGPRGEERLDERAAPGRDFLAELCTAWESEAARAEASGVRVVRLRFGMVLARAGGALPRMLPPFRLGLGGPIGPADRFTPWIHVDDAAGLARFAAGEAGSPGAALSGPVNAVAPETVRMGDFARALGRALGRPALLPVPELLLRVVLGEAAAAVVPGQRVVPTAAVDAGYRFAWPTLAGALANLLGRGAR